MVTGKNDTEQLNDVSLTLNHHLILRAYPTLTIIFLFVNKILDFEKQTK